MNINFEKKIMIVVVGCVIFPLALFSENLYDYSRKDFLRDQRRLEYSTQEWKDIAYILMNMSFKNQKQDVTYIKELPVYQNILILSFLHRWEKNLYYKSNYIKLLSGSSKEYDRLALKNLFKEKLLQYVSEGTVSAEFLSDLGDYVAVHKNIFTQKELDDLIVFFPKIKSNMVKNSFFYILLSNNFFLRRELPPQYSNYLDSMLYKKTNILRKRLKLPLLPARNSSTSVLQD